MKYLHKSFCYLGVLLLSLALLSSCDDPYRERFEEQKAADEASIKQYLEYYKITNAVRQPSGLYYIPVSPGNGTKVQKNSRVETQHIGRTFSGNKFDSTYDRGQNHFFQLGNGSMIKGLDEGLQLMEKDERATLIIPSGLGYGQYGNYSSIGGNEILIYEIKIVNIN